MIFQIKSNPITVSLVNNLDFVPHAHHGIEIFVCCEGECRVSCNFKTEILRKGDLMIAFSNDIHSYIGDLIGKGYTVIIDPALLGSFADFSEKTYENFLLCGDERFVSLCEGLYNEFIGDKCTEILVGYIHIILGEALKSLKSQSGTASLSADLFSEVLKYLSENYMKKITLRQTSKHFGVSAEHLSRIFTQKLSCPFTKYLHFLRIEHAKHLLSFSSKSILEVAMISGFSDQRTFNRVFKSLVALSPAKYRKIHKK